MTEPLRIAQISDTHLQPSPFQRTRGILPDRTLDAVLAKVRDFAPHLVIASGDLSDRGDEASYRRLRRQLLSLACPVAAIAGNHDVPQNLRRFLLGGAIHGVRVWDFDDWSILLGDSQLDGRVAGLIGNTQRSQLEAALAKRSRQHRLVCVHHPPVEVGGSWIDRFPLLDGDELVALCARQDVRILSFGHIHHLFEARHDGLAILSAPSTANQAKPKSHEHREDLLGPGFRAFVLASDGRWRSRIVRTQASARALSS